MFIHNVIKTENYQQVHYRCTMFLNVIYFGNMLFGPYRNNMCEFASKNINKNGYCLDFNQNR